MEETGVNPFTQGFSSTLSQLAMEQDFVTGGNDDIFGSNLESNIAAVRNLQTNENRKGTSRRKARPKVEK